MLAVLIYMAVVTVTAGISPTLNILPFSNLISGKKGETPDQHLKAKRLVEQWIKSILSLALATFVINLMVSFSNNIVNMMAGKEVKNESITIYVKNSKFAANAPILGGSGENSINDTSNISNVSSDEANNLRKKIVEQASSLDNLNVSAGNCLRWVRKVYNEALGKDFDTFGCCAHNAALISKVTYSSTDNIVPGAAVFSYKSSGNVKDDACNLDAGHVGIYIGNGKIASLTGRGSTGVVINTIDEWKNSWEFSCWGWPIGTEYLAEGAVGDSLASSESAESKTVDYYFKTNLEGLFKFRSQYNPNLYMGRWVINWVCEGFMLAFKITLDCLLGLRMLLVAVITTITPIIILIDAFKKIGGGKGFLTNWIKLYMYLLLFRPIVSFLYYILVQSNVYLISEFPYYIVFVIIAIWISIGVFIWYLIRDLRTKKDKNAVSSSH